MLQSIQKLTASSLLLALSSTALADGTETLGAPQGIAPIAGSDYILVGAGLADAESATLSASIPSGASIVQVLAYWDGLALAPNLPGETDTILLNGISVTGAKIGGPSNFIGPYNAFAYRADVTNLGLIANGENSVTGGGLDFDFRNNGFGLMIVLNDGTASETLELRDGSDFAYGDFAGPYASTALQTFSFASEEDPRSAQLGLFVTGVDEGRPSIIEVTIGDQVTRHIDILGSHSGSQWDALELDLEIPAGTTTASVQILSEDAGTGAHAGAQIASLNWIASSLSIETLDAGMQYGCTPHFWICNWWRFDPWCTSDNYTGSIVLTDRWNTLMGVNRWQSGLRNGRRVWSALVGYGSCWGGWQKRALNRHAAAAMLNADSDINYPYTVDQVRALYQDAVGAIDGPETVYSVLCTLYAANNLGCPW